MGTDKSLVIIHYQYHLSILIGSSLRVTITSQQHIKDITSMHINYMQCDRTFVHVGGVPRFVVIGDVKKVNAHITQNTCLKSNSPG